MSSPSRGIHSAQVVLNTHGQTREHIDAIVASILGRGGCLHCGQLAYLTVQFSVDPGPDLTKIGVMSFNAHE